MSSADASATRNATTTKRSRPKVTVITVSYRTSALVTRLLASLAEDRLRCRETTELRVIVVDNASGDAPALREAIRRLGMQHFTSLIEAPQNGGFAFGNNLGFEHAYETCQIPDYFFLLNPDTEVRPFAIETLVRFMEQHPNAGIAGSRLESEQGDPWPYVYRFPSLWSEAEAAIGWSLVTRLLRGQVVARRVTDTPERADWIPGASMLVRRQVIDRLGGMDEGYFLYYEETDFCRKVKAAGFDVWYAPASRVMHIGGQSTGMTASGVDRRSLPSYQFESRRRYFIKNHGIAYAMATDMTALLGYSFGRIKLALQRRNERAVPHYLRDLARHSCLLPKNRKLAPVHEFRPSKGTKTATHTSDSKHACFSDA